MRKLDVILVKVTIALVLFTLPAVGQDLEDVQPPERFEPGSEDELLEILNDNPLSPLGNDLEVLVNAQINEDLWQSMLGDLPCLTSSNECVSELTSMAISNSRSLKAIEERVTGLEGKIDEARARNQRSVNLGTFTPLLQNYVSLENETYQEVQPNLLNGLPQIVTRTRQVGFFEKLARALRNPIGAINEVLSIIGIPLFENRLQIDANVQTREIAISDLQIRIAQIEQEKQKVEDTIASSVVEAVIDFDTTRRDFQISQEIARRSQLQATLLKVDYLFGDSNTQAYLNQQSAIDREKANAFKAWAKLRAQLANIKILVLGAQPF